MGKIACRLEDEKYLVFTYPGVEVDLKVDVQFNYDSENPIEATNYYGVKVIWYSVGNEAEQWFTKAWGMPVILVRSPTLLPISTDNVEHKLTDNYR